MGATHLPGNGVREHADIAPPRAREAATSARPAFTIADPGPLGLAAFALTTFVLSAPSRSRRSAPSGCRSSPT